MSFFRAIRQYFSVAFRWQRGRQGTGYDKMLLLTARWPVPFDSYLIRYPAGASIPPHTDPVQLGQHYRLNVVLKSSPAGGEFVCATPIFASRRIKLFRPDACEHSVTHVEGGSRYVLSIGWVLKAAGTA
ncbi:MAG: 2OG-Fe(II) oxygenase [Burkholderiales bacterium]|nr:2OG-Fe(II) oxygenase [Burkholderiales bacterium]